MNAIAAKPLLTALWRLSRHAFVRRAGVVMFGSGMSALLSFVTQLLCARTMDVAAYGQLVALLAAVGIAAVFSGYGIGWFWLQLFGREGRAALRWVTPTLQLLATTVCLGAALVSGFVLLRGGAAASSPLIAVLVVAVLLGQSLTETTASRLQLEERYVLLAIWQTLTQAGRFVVTVLLIGSASIGLLHLLIGYAAVGLAITALSVVSLVQVWSGRIELVGHSDARMFPQPVSITTALVGATPYCLSIVFYLVYSQGVVVLVERTLGAEDAAMYNAAYLIITAIYLIPSVIYVKYLMSKIFRWSEHDQDRFSAAIHIGVVCGAILGLFFMVVVMLSAPFVIPTLFGPRYAAAVPILMLLSLAIPVRCVQHAYGAAFFSENNMKRKVWYLGGAALTCLALSAALIPTFKLAGAAAAAVASEVALLALFMRGIARHVDAIDLRATFTMPQLRAALAYIDRRG